MLAADTRICRTGPHPDSDPHVTSVQCSLGGGRLARFVEIAAGDPRILTFPVGGTVELRAEHGAPRLTITSH